MRRKMVFSIWETRKKIRNSSRSFSKVARRAEDEPWNKVKMFKSEQWYNLEWFSPTVMCLDKIRSIKRMCCFYKRMFSASGKFFCVYTEKNGMKHDEVENFSQLYFQEKDK